MKTNILSNDVAPQPAAITSGLLGFVERVVPIDTITDEDESTPSVNCVEWRVNHTNPRRNSRARSQIGGLRWTTHSREPSYRIRVLAVTLE